ncbi:uncharacterized protein LOC132728368 [Ruditapes philippinarum]|uniref:uncharacterized protein LOC132728368 n=1 Tax=Ruditapes philippinarum TaxID=129788 RepID=UPI00295B5E40|nr:uncharacterized protein LOC132728368 [Ruditapes philippinarum]
MADETEPQRKKQKTEEKTTQDEPAGNSNMGDFIMKAAKMISDNIDSNTRAVRQNEKAITKVSEELARIERNLTAAGNTPPTFTIIIIEKWESWFNANDFNRDRVLSMDDIKLFENYYKDLGYLSDEHLKEINKRTDRIWRKIILNNTLEITKDDFVEMLKQKYEADKEVFTEMIREYISDWCEMMDLNDDYIISKEEFLTNVFASRHNTIAADDL